MVAGDKKLGLDPAYDYSTTSKEHSTEMIHVIATIQLAPDSRAQFLQEFAKIVPLVRQEAGCLFYEPAVDVATEIAAQAPPRPDVVTVVEQWESLAALEDHLKAPHMDAYRERVRDMVQSAQLVIAEPAVAT